MASDTPFDRSCAQAVAEDGANFDHHVRPATDSQPRSLGKYFIFVERPSEDFFCPVSLELLLEPQLTSCCGHHLSLEAATRLQREGKPCPMCNGRGWGAVLDKYHRRKVHEVRVCCWHKENGCEWVGEVNELKRHTDSCVKRPWECQYCALKCTYGEGEGKHWPTCPKFPEPCPNSCEVGSVERCNMEQHCSVCSLEPVACEMKEFGCSVVVPRKELATHMRESELQHLTAMTMLNLRLSRQLQQDSTERDRNITQLQQEMTKLQAEMNMRIDEQDQLKRQLQGSTERDRKLQQEVTDQRKLQIEIKGQMVQLLQQQSLQAEQMKEQKGELSKIAQLLQHLTPTPPQPPPPPPIASPPVAQGATGGGPWSGTTCLTITQYTRHMDDGEVVFSDPFYTHYQGYKFKLQIDFYDNDIGAGLYLIKGEYDRQLPWPVKVDVRLELLNQAGNSNHVVRTTTITWTKSEKERDIEISDNLIKYSTLERQCGNVRHMMCDCLEFEITVTVV